MKNIKRTLLIGVIWGLIFFLWWLKGFLYKNWNFDIFSLYSWQYLYNEFISGWVVSATSDWIFVWTLIFAIPLFLIGWSLFVKVQWRKSFFGFFKKILYFIRGQQAKVTKKKFKYVKKKSHQKVRPVPLYKTAKALEKESTAVVGDPSLIEASAAAAVKNIPSGKGALSGMGDADFFAGPKTDEQKDVMPSYGSDTPSSNKMFGAAGSSTTTTAGADGMPSFLDDSDFSNIALDDIKMPERTALVEDISGLLLKAGYKVIADIMLNDLKIDYVAVDATQIFMLVSDNEKGDWLADEERFNGEDPLWFSESSHRTSPIYTMMAVLNAFGEKLKAKGDMHTVKPVLVEREGVLINAEDMAKTWQDMGILVVRTHLGGPDELPSVEKGIPPAGNPASDADVELIRRTF